MKIKTSGPDRDYSRKLGWFLAPYLIGTLILVILPATMTLGTAFTNYQGIQTPKWVGLENFQRMGETPLVRQGLFNSLVFMAAAVPLRLLGALGLSLLLKQRRKSGLAGMAAFLPTIIPETAYALIWLWILNPVFGPLNQLLGLFGIAPQAWMAEAGTARLAIILMSLMQVGEGFVVLIAAQQMVPKALFEAAKMDGANRWQAFWQITMPLILPWIMILVCRDLVVAVQNTFTPSYVLAYGGPYYTTTFMPLLVYELSFDFMDLGLASAVLVVFYAWILLLIWGVRNLVQGLRKREGWDA